MIVNKKLRSRFIDWNSPCFQQKYINRPIIGKKGCNKKVSACKHVMNTTLKQKSGYCKKKILFCCPHLLKKRVYLPQNRPNGHNKEREL
jgi:hypothetical protein